MTLELDKLHQIFKVDFELGTLEWKELDSSFFKDSYGKKGLRTAQASANMRNSKFAGKPALISKGKHGHLGGEYKGKSYSANRVIFAMYHGYWPNNIDHIDGNPSNNNIHNLRDVTHQENMKNKAKNRRNATGENGVSFNKAHCRRNKPFQVTVGVNGFHKFIGRFKTLEEAVKARNEAYELYDFHPNHGRD